MGVPIKQEMTVLGIGLLHLMDYVD